MRIRSAFTLVELLVVIGIIAILVAILLPALGRAREQANRTVCLSNMRDLGTAFRIYATTFNDVCPVGYVANINTANLSARQKQFSYVIHWSNGTQFKATQMGVLVLAGIMKVPKTYYCPSSLFDPQFQFNTPQNPWPFDAKGNPPTVAPATHTRTPYNTRPCAGWGIAGTSPSDLNNGPPFLDPTPSTPAGRNIYAYPKFSMLKNKAMIADLVRFPADVKKTHRDGINVLYGHGGAMWVPLKVFNKPPWSDIPDQQVVSTYNAAMLDESRAPGNPRGLWVDLDRQSR
ncbi:MAG: type II secretion system GspH family protein [Phycisphaerae bacterium]|nr:type II secretion system GspH family protein [Phycisphaerae bacterium]MDW8262712.1 type II secretion system protein [Phycisphaerales bacterium]